MNTKLLQKCIDKLSEEKPNIPYVLGILETLKEIADEPVNPGNHFLKTSTSIVPAVIPNPVEEMTPEEKEYYAKMAGGTIAPMHE